MAKKIYVLTESIGEDVSIAGVFNNEESLKTGLAKMLDVFWTDLAKGKMRRESIVKNNPTMTIQELHDATIEESVGSLYRCRVLRVERLMWRIQECQMNEVIE